MSHAKKEKKQIHESDPIETAEEKAPDEIETLKQQVEQLNAELNEARELVVRGLADLQNAQREFQNYRKRTFQEMAALRNTATESFIVELLPVLDNFERTIRHHESGATVEALVEGVRAVERQLKSALESQNVRKIPAVGQPFDPEIHEAIGTEEHAEHADDTVSTEIEAGYKMGEKIIRPARVKVAKSG